MKNRFEENITTGKISLGTVITLSDLCVSELAGDCGMDFCWIDAEHAPHTIETVHRHLIALRGTGCAGLVRVRANDPEYCMEADELERAVCRIREIMK